MREIPSDRGVDSTLQLLLEGYRFITHRCERLQSNIFQTRLLFKKTICLRGEDAAKVFYDNERFCRKNAAPKRVQKTLLGEGGVQGLDGETHRQRKQVFMSLMTPENMGKRQRRSVAARQFGVRPVAIGCGVQSLHQSHPRDGGSQRLLGWLPQ